jgi:hypothetical protein
MKEFFQNEEKFLLDNKAHLHSDKFNQYWNTKKAEQAKANKAPEEFMLIPGSLSIQEEPRPIAVEMNQRYPMQNSNMNPNLNRRPQQQQQQPQQQQPLQPQQQSNLGGYQQPRINGNIAGQGPFPGMIQEEQFMHQGNNFHPNAMNNRGMNVYQPGSNVPRVMTSQIPQNQMAPQGFGQSYGRLDL